MFSIDQSVFETLRPHTYIYGHYITFVCLPKGIQLPNEQLAIICNFSLYLADKANMPDETGSKLKVHVDVICEIGVWWGKNGFYWGRRSPF